MLKTLGNNTVNQPHANKNQNQPKNTGKMSVAPTKTAGWYWDQALESGVVHPADKRRLVESFQSCQRHSCPFLRRKLRHKRA